MDDLELDPLERDLARVSDRLAAERRWQDLGPRMRRLLRRPYWELAQAAGLALAVAALGLHDDDPALLALALGLLVAVVPERVRAARGRSVATTRLDGDLFARCAAETRRRFATETVVLVLAVPLVFALLVAAAAVPDPAVPLVLAGLVLVALPHHVLVRMRRTARDLAEARRWAGEPDEDDGPPPDDGAPIPWGGIVRSSFWVFVLYLGPPLAVVLLVLAARGPERVRPLAVAASLVFGWVYAWRAVAADDEEDAG